MTSSPDPDARRYEALKREVVDIGLIRRGSLVRRFVPCGKPGCRCQAQPPQLHGPYYQWTRKLSGKTVTVRIQPHEAKLLAQWIENGRQLNRIVKEMERVSLQITERLLQDEADRSPGEADNGRRGKPTTRPTKRKARKKRLK